MWCRQTAGDAHASSLHATKPLCLVTRHTQDTPQQSAPTFLVVSRMSLNCCLTASSLNSVCILLLKVDLSWTDMEAAAALAVALVVRSSSRRRKISVSAGMRKGLALGLLRGGGEVKGQGGEVKGQGVV